jgi:predicted anti-sigma-YlaC factor YlaD
MHCCNIFVYIVAALLYALLEQGFCMHVYTKFVCILSIPSGAEFLYNFFARTKHVSMHGSKLIITVLIL